MNLKSLLSTKSSLLYLLMILLSRSVMAHPPDTIKPIQRIDKQFLVYVHIVVIDTNKNWGNVSLAAIQAGLSAANQYFEPIGATFELCGSNVIENYKYDTLDWLKNESNEMMEMHHKTQKLNIYFVDEVINTPFPVCGYNTGAVTAFTQSRGIVMKKGCSSGLVFAHEIGHYFGLGHTHDGSGTELADGSNCRTAGDGFCDTPADPLVPTEPRTDYVNDKCEFISLKKDANGDFYDPDVSNVMSYYLECTCQKFSKEQYNSMVKFYNQSLGSW